MTENAFAACLAAILNDECGINESFDFYGVRGARPFDEMGVRTRNAGLVVQMDDGSEYQITVVRFRGPHSEQTAGSSPAKENDMAEKKTKTAKKTAAKPKVETAPDAKAANGAKPKKEKAPKEPRESRDGWGTFALKMPVPEREAFHKAAGPASASKFARVVLVAFANEDEAAFKTAIKEAREARQ